VPSNPAGKDDPHMNHETEHDAQAPRPEAPSLPEDMLIVLPVRNLVMFPGVVMPNLGLSEADAGDLLAYLDNRTARLAAPGHSETEHSVTRETVNVKQ
jgi:hypothetical protein